MSEESIREAQLRLQAFREKITQENEQDGWGRGSQEEIVGILTAMTRSIHASSMTHNNEYNRLAEKISGMERDVSHIKDDVSLLCHLVRDGNGQPSLMQRIGSIEGTVKGVSQELGEVKKHANTIIAAKALSKSQVVAGLIGMIVTALLSTLALVATLLK